jgi:hypothetical protein
VCSTAGGENGGKGWIGFFSGVKYACDERYTNSVPDAGFGYNNASKAGFVQSEIVIKPVRSVVMLCPTASGSCNIPQVAVKMLREACWAP